ncbi:MAG: AraC family transcriptional regulator ligand-binding domain-containing protein [Pseudomonadota bacterium]|nr:AraC family transcriptional regulator ligand-binding domain-containing protein [Pseudomonadota bacterium]
MQAFPQRLTFPAFYVETTLSLIRAYRGDPNSCYQRLGISPDMALQPNYRLSAEQFEQLLLLCMEHLLPGEPKFIQALHHIPTTAHGLIGIAAMTSDTLGDALDLAIRYFGLLAPSIEVYYHDFRGEIHVTFKENHRFEPAVQAFFLELVVGSIGRIAKFANNPQIAQLGRLSTVSMQVQFMHECTEDMVAYQRYFGAPVQFGCRENKFVISRQVLSQPLLTRNRATRVALEATLKQQLHAVQHSQSMTQMVRQLLMHRLNQSQLPNANETAEYFAMSVRTLSRRLHEENTSLIEISQQVRIERAQQLLLDGTMPLSKIAKVLGFSNSASFSRAFRQAMGCTPRDFRKKPNEPVVG